MPVDLAEALDLRTARERCETVRQQVLALWQTAHDEQDRRLDEDRLLTPVQHARKALVHEVRHHDAKRKGNDRKQVLERRVRVTTR